MKTIVIILVAITFLSAQGTNSPQRPGRRDVLNNAVNAAGAGVATIEALSNSGNPDIAATAMGQLVDARDVRDDLAVIAALVGNKPENEHRLQRWNRFIQRITTLQQELDREREENTRLQARLVALKKEVREAMRNPRHAGEKAPLAGAEVLR